MAWDVIGRIGSPSQISATSSPWPLATCRSTQLWQALSVAPTNHFASGAFQSSTLVQGVNQSIILAASPQKPSGSWIDRWWSFLYSSNDETCHFSKPRACALAGG